MKITTLGIDLAKSVFQLHGVDERGKTVLKKKLKLAEMAEFFVNLPPFLIGMEACGSAHHWARKLQGFGHTTKLMAPQFVKPYVKSNKNDAADAARLAPSRLLPIRGLAACRGASGELPRMRQNESSRRTVGARG